MSKLYVVLDSVLENHLLHVSSAPHVSHALTFGEQHELAVLVASPQTVFVALYNQCSFETVICMLTTDVQISQLEQRWPA